MGRSRYKILDESYPYFITSSILKGYELFIDERICELVIEGIDFLISQRDVVVYAYVIMPNHIHLIVEGKDLANYIAHFKSYSSRRIIDYLKLNERAEELYFFRSNKLTFKKDRVYQVWQEGYHPKEISSHKIMNQKIGYIHYNPVKAGLVSNCEEWKYSSYGLYNGGFSKLPLKVFGDY
ncbi:MAG: transposase [Balneola sp.]